MDKKKKKAFHYSDPTPVEMPFSFGGPPTGWHPPMLPPQQDTGQAAAPVQGLQEQNAPPPTMPSGVGNQVMGLGGTNKELGQLQQQLQDEEKYKDLTPENYGSQAGGWARSIGNAISDVAHTFTKKHLNDQIQSSLKLLQAQQAQAMPGYLQATYGIQPAPNVTPGQPTMPMSQGGLTTGGGGALSINNGPPQTPEQVFGF